MVLPTSKLDFDTLKESLKTYLRKQDQFSDFDFEGSGISNVLDVLAYNSQVNALSLNFALNEAYLSSAQLRSSVISIAQSLGYFVRSKTSSYSIVNLSLDLTSTAIRPLTIELPIYTKFTSIVDGASYTFQTLEPYFAVNNNGVYQFLTSDGSPNIQIYEGQFKTKTFIVQATEPSQSYVIPDLNLDASSVKVKVFDSFSSSNFVAYSNLYDVFSITPTSRLFKLSEAPSGFYQLDFGDGVITGAVPSVGNKIVVEYVSTSASLANGCSVFSPISPLNVNSVNYPISVRVVSKSFGGSEKQTIDSIKFNAPLSYAAQRRLVTPNDYKTDILSRFSVVKDCSVWGGEDNDKPKYGTVFISIIFENNTPLEIQQLIKNRIVDTISKNLGIVSISVEFVDPQVTYIEPTVVFDYNPDFSNFTQQSLETFIRQAIIEYSGKNLNTFSNVGYRKSKVLSEIDAIDDSILSSDILIRVQKRFTPSIALRRGYEINFPVKILTPQETRRVIQSSNFIYDGQVCQIVNKLGSTKLQIVTTAGNIVVDNIGYYNALGNVIITGFRPQSLLNSTFIKISVLPEENLSLVGKRSSYYTIDDSTIIINARIANG